MKLSLILICGAVLLLVGAIIMFLMKAKDDSKKNRNKKIAYGLGISSIILGCVGGWMSYKNKSSCDNEVTIEELDD